MLKAIPPLTEEEKNWKEKDRPYFLKIMYDSCRQMALQQELYFIQKIKPMMIPK